MGVGEVRAVGGMCVCVCVCGGVGGHAQSSSYTPTVLTLKEHACSAATHIREGVYTYVALIQVLLIPTHPS